MSMLYTGKKKFEKHLHIHVFLLCFGLIESKH